MAGPWDKYGGQQSTAKPWERYAAQPAPVPGDSPEGLGEQFAGGAVDALLTLPGAVSDLMLFAADKIGQQYGAAPLKPEDYAENPLGSNTVRSMLKDYVSPDMFGRAPRTTAERYARRVGEFAGPGVALGPLNPRTAMAAVTGGLGSRAAQDAFPDSAIAPIVGGLVGGLVPSAARAVTGGGMAPQTAKLAKQMIDEGIPIYPGQVGSRPTKLLYDATTRLPFMGQGPRNAQLKAFNSAIARTFGENSDAITPDVMHAARTRLSGEFNEIFAKGNVPVDTALLDKLGDIELRAVQNLSEQQSAQIAKAVTAIMDKSAAGNGILSGRSYHAFTSKGGALQNVTGSADSNVKFYAGQVREALDDAFARANPDAAPKLAKAKAQFRALKVIEPLAVKATDGNISPALLLGRVAANDPKMAYTGGGKLGTLARGAKEFLKEQPSSTTPERQMIYGAIGSGGVASAYLAPQVLAPAAAVYGGARLTKALMESRTIGGAMVANAIRRAAKRPPARLSAAAGNPALPGSVGLAGRQNVPVENRPALRGRQR